MRRTKEEAAQTRQDILDAALVEFSEKGYQAARLQDIARLAGTTRGAIYHHFEHKADLYKTLIEEAAQQSNRAVQRAIEAGGEFADICRNIILFSAQLLAEDERFRQITALFLFKAGTSPELAEVEAMRMESAISAVQGVAGYMKIGMEMGAARTDLSPQTLARAFLAYQNGLAWLWLANEEFFSITAEAEALADILMNGISHK